jgi:DNA-binding response OmpR family regulator
VVDVPAHRASVGGRAVHLTSFEFRVLTALARRVGEPVSREDLASAVLPNGDQYDPSVDRSLDVHISHLRQKLGEGSQPKRIRTVRGIGYVLVKPS